MDSQRERFVGIMSKTKLIGKQQIEIELLEESVTSLLENLRHIDKMLVCLGGPLNGNKLQFSIEQLIFLSEIHIACIGGLES